MRLVLHEGATKGNTSTLIHLYKRSVSRVWGAWGVTELEGDCRQSKLNGHDKCNTSKNHQTCCIQMNWLHCRQAAGQTAEKSHGKLSPHQEECCPSPRRYKTLSLLSVIVLVHNGTPRMTDTFPTVNIIFPVTATFVILQPSGKTLTHLTCKLC